MANKNVSMFLENHLPHHVKNKTMAAFVFRAYVPQLGKYYVLLLWMTCGNDHNAMTEKEAIRIRHYEETETLYIELSRGRRYETVDIAKGPHRY